ncbi:MAG: HTTM domain-containing protein [Myxococcales bacterium]|nr:HTTM domain-containing protein [Myxococcales bacterium]
MRRLWSSAVELLGRREPADGLALFRIAVGLCMLYSIGSMAAAGLDQVFWVDAADGGMLELRSGDHWLIRALGGPRAPVIGALVPLGLLLALLVTVGAGGRVVLLIAGQVYQAIVRSDPTIIGGYDLLIGNALWILFLAGATATLSVDARLRRGSWRPAVEIAAWPRYLLILQILAVYTTTGLSKLGVPWTPAGGFSALYWVFQEPTWRRFDMGWTAAAPAVLVLQVATALTWIWEISAIFLLLFYYYRATPARPGRLRALCVRRDLRLGFVAIGVALHLSILLTLNVGPFSWISVAYYLNLFHPDELRALARRRPLRAGGEDPAHMDSIPGGRDPR